MLQGPTPGASCTPRWSMQFCFLLCAYSSSISFLQSSPWALQNWPKPTGMRGTKCQVSRRRTADKKIKKIKSWHRGEVFMSWWLMTASLLSTTSYILFTRERWDRVSMTLWHNGTKLAKANQAILYKGIRGYLKCVTDWAPSNLENVNYSSLREKVRFPGTEILTPLRPWPQSQTLPC